MNLALLFFSVFLHDCCKTDIKMNNLNSEQVSIIHAVKNNQLTIVEAELKKGTNVNTIDQSRKSLLLIATYANNLEMAKLLVSHGADVNQQDNQKDSPFLYAGATGYTDLVKLFLQNGARFDIFNRYNGSALIPACERGYVDVVRILSNTKGFPIDHVNRLGWTALMEAVYLGDGSEKYVEVVQILVDAGCNINIPDKDGITAMQHAKSRGYVRIVEVLEKVSKKP
jgi:uncharacterized protein